MSIGRKGIYHTVERGQTLWRICKAYGVEMQEVAEINGIGDPTQIKVGQEIFIPGARKELKVEPAPSLVRDTPTVLRPQSNKKETPQRPPPSSGKSPGKLLWPVPGGKLYSPFGMRDGQMHEGMDISAKAIEIARAWTKKKGLEAHLEVGDLKKLPFENGYFAFLLISISNLSDVVSPAKISESAAHSTLEIQ